MKQIELTSLCSLNMGQSPESSTYNEVGEGLPFFQGNADFGEIHPETRVWCSSPTKIANAGDILISVRAPIGAMNIAAEQCCIGRGLAALTPIDGKCNQQYLYYAIQSRVEGLIAQGTGSTFKAIGKKVLESTLIPAYPLEEQAEIVAKLQKIDSAIRERCEQQRLLNQLVKSRFIELFGDPVSNSMQWPVHQLSDFISFLTSGSRGWAQYFTDSGEYFITIKNVKDCRITLDNVQCVTPPQNAEAKRTKVEPGDLLISITADLGRTGVVTEEIAGHGAYINQHLTCIRLNKDALHPLYAAYFMESEAGKMQFNAKNQSAVKAGLNFNSINSLQIIVPPLALQEQFVSFIEQTDKSKLAVQQGLQELEILKKSLMQQYFG